MKVNYRGYEVEANREKCLGGWDMLYFSIFRLSDGLEVVSDFSDSGETVRDSISMLKNRVDKFIETRGESEEMAGDYDEQIHHNQLIMRGLFMCLWYG